MYYAENRWEKLVDCIKEFVSN